MIALYGVMAGRSPAKSRPSASMRKNQHRRQASLSPPSWSPKADHPRVCLPRIQHREVNLAHCHRNSIPFVSATPRPRGQTRPNALPQPTNPCGKPRITSRGRRLTRWALAAQFNVPSPYFGFFSHRGDPNMDDKTLLQQERFSACIGRLIISWGQLELSLEFSIALIHEGLGGNKLQSEKPRMLEAKLTYLRRAAHELAPLKAHRKSTLKLADDLEAASIMRHDIVHGAIISPPNNPIGADMLRVRPGTLTGIAEFSEHETDGSKLEEGEPGAVEVLPVLG